MKISKRHLPQMINEVFYLRQNTIIYVFSTDNTRNKFMLNSTVSRANHLQQTLPSEVKDCSSLQLFKNQIKIWHYDRHQCQICSGYLTNVGYFQHYLCSVVDMWQNCAPAKCKQHKCHFAVKTMHVLPCILSKIYQLRCKVMTSF